MKGVVAFLTLAATLAAQQPLALRRPAVPEGTGHPLDRLLRIDGALVEDSLFARRVYLDLWGLLPTPEQLDEFVAGQRADKRSQLVARLLADKQNYTEHWITFWNDLLRNDEGVIYHGERKSITSWLRRALGDNLPYDQFVATLLNPRRPEDPEGFLTGVTWRGEIPASELPPMQAAQSSAQVFLGVNLKCNACHDSFISRWKLKDAYGLASFFSEGPLELVRCEVKTGQPAQPQFLFPELGTVPEGLSLPERRAAAARFFTAPENGRLPRTFVNRVWKQLFGRGIVEPVDEMSAAPWNADLLDWLAADFADHGYDVKFLLSRILTSRAYALPSAAPQNAKGKDYIFRGPERRRLAAEQFVDAIASITGEWRVLQSSRPVPGAYSREWQLKSTALTRALGRPQRDQVTTERLTQPTTLQALELVNGRTLADALHRGAQRMLGVLPPVPSNLFDSGTLNLGRKPVPVGIDITGVKRLWLLIEDAGSYDPQRTRASWADAELIGPEGALKVHDYVPPMPVAGLRVPARVAIDIAHQRFTRFKALASIDPSSAGSEINANVRFFVFSEQPDLQQLVRVAGDPPLPAPPRPNTPEALITRIYRHALSRQPSDGERRAAGALLGARATVDGLEDLLWAVLMTPEFQFIR